MTSAPAGRDVGLSGHSPDLWRTGLRSTVAAAPPSLRVVAACRCHERTLSCPSLRLPGHRSGPLAHRTDHQAWATGSAAPPSPPPASAPSNPDIPARTPVPAGKSAAAAVPGQRVADVWPVRGAARPGHPEHGGGRHGYGRCRRQIPTAVAGPVPSPRQDVCYRASCASDYPDRRGAPSGTRSSGGLRPEEAERPTSARSARPA